MEKDHVRSGSPAGTLLGLALGLLASPAPLRAAVDLLPDVISIEDELLVNDVSWGVEPGCAALRLNAGTANVGEGPVHLYGVLPANPDGTQDVRQRIYRDDQTFWDRYAGSFLYHSSHNHIHFEGWGIYRLREVLAGNGVGAILAEGEKTSFCLVDYLAHDLGLPGAPSSPVYASCDTTVQGISVGWADVYVKVLPGQSISLCGIPNGTYWLESEADPDDGVLESDETNNVSRVQVTIQIPAPPVCNDGLDNDGDSFADYPADAGCYQLTSKRENPACNDGLDNDQDSHTDYPEDPTCQAAWAASEGPSPGAGCGLGAEIALVLAALDGLRRRRAARLYAPPRAR